MGHAGTGAGGLPVIAECRLLQHGEKLIVRHLASRRRDGIRLRRFAALPVRGRDLVACRHACPPDEIRQAIHTRPLNSDRYERLAIDRAGHHVVISGALDGRAPLHVDVTVVALGRYVIGNRQRRRGARRWLIVHSNVVDDQHVPDAIRAQLVKDDALQSLRVERIHGRRAQLREWNAYLHPSLGGKVARIGRHRFLHCETTGHRRHLQALSRIRQHHAGQVGGRDRLRRIHPEIKSPAG